MNTYLKVTLIFSLSILIVSCSCTHSVFNATDQSLYSVQVDSCGTSFNHGVLITKGRSSLGNPIPFKKGNPPKVYWTDSEGKRNSETVELSFRPTSAYELFFVISKDDVKVVPMRNDRTLEEYGRFLRDNGIIDNKLYLEGYAD